MDGPREGFRRLVGDVGLHLQAPGPNGNRPGLSHGPRQCHREVFEREGLRSEEHLRRELAVGV